MLRLFAVALIALACVGAQAEDVFIGGFFPGSGWPILDKVEPAHQIALAEINSGNSSLLPGYTLKSRTVDTRCSAGVATGAFQSQVESGEEIRAIVGAGCSGVSLALSSLNGPSSLGYRYNVPLVSWGSTSDRLSDKDSHPFFSRVVSPDASQAFALIKFLKSNGWSRVALLSQPGEPHASLRLHFLEIAANEGVDVIQNSQLDNDANRTLQMIPYLTTESENAGARIFVLIANAEIAASTLSGYGDAGLASAGYQWVGTDAWANVNLADADVSPVLSEAQRAAMTQHQAGAFVTTVDPGQGATHDALREAVNAGSDIDTPLFPYASYVYDATYVVAVALHEVLVNQRVPQVASDFGARLNSAIRSTVIAQGASGEVSFDRSGDRATSYAVFNNQPAEVFPFTRKVATISQQGAIVREEGVPVFFQGGVAEAPTDGGDPYMNQEPGSPYWLAITALLIILPITGASTAGLIVWLTDR